MSEMTNSIGALYAYDVDGRGRGWRLDPEHIPAPKDGDGYRWVHLDMDHPGAEAWIAAQADPLVAEALTIEDTRPRYFRFGEGFLLNLRGVNLNPASDPEDMVSIRLWACGRLIVSARRRLMAVVALREALEAGAGPQTPGRFIAALSEGLTERMAPVVDGVADEVDALEETSLDSAAGLRASLVDIRRTTIVLRRYIGPQRDALGRLAGESGDFFDAADQTRLRETIDRITRLVEEMDAVRERCAVLNDQLADARAEEMNRNMMVLSVVAAIFLPLGFLTGLLGVNVGGVPGADNPYAFALLCLLMTLVGLGITLFFRKLKWI